MSENTTKNEIFFIDEKHIEDLNNLDLDTLSALMKGGEAPGNNDYTVMVSTIVEQSGTYLIRSMQKPTKTGVKKLSAILTVSNVPVPSKIKSSNSDTIISSIPIDEQLFRHTSSAALSSIYAAGPNTIAKSGDLFFVGYLVDPHRKQFHVLILYSMERYMKFHQAKIRVYWGSFGLLKREFLEESSGSTYSEAIMKAVENLDLDHFPTERGDRPSLIVRMRVK